MVEKDTLVVNRNRYSTQWAGQFFVAAELTRRGYTIAFTLGNANSTDIIVVSPKQKEFRVEVKSQTSRNFWRIKRNELLENHYFVLVLVGSTADFAPKYYLMTCEEMLRIRQANADRTSGGKFKDESNGGFNFTESELHHNRWDILPD